MNLQDNKVKSRIGKSVFLYMHGSNQRPLIMKMSRANLDRNIEYIVKRIGMGSQFGIGVNEIKVMSSQNPNIAMLKDLRMRNSYSRISWWWYDEKFESKYGPFELEDTISVLNAKNPVNEDDDDTNNEEREEDNSEEVIEQIYDNIDGVEEVSEIGDDKFVVSIP